MLEDRKVKIRFHEISQLTSVFQRSCTSKGLWHERSLSRVLNVRLSRALFRPPLDQLLRERHWDPAEILIRERDL